MMMNTQIPLYSAVALDTLYGSDTLTGKSRLHKEILNLRQENCLHSNTLIDLIKKYKMMVLCNT